MVKFDYTYFLLLSIFLGLASCKQEKVSTPLVKYTPTEIDYSTYTEDQYKFVNVELPIYKIYNKKMENILNQLDRKPLTYPKFEGAELVFKSIQQNLKNYLDQFPNINPDNFTPLNQRRKRIIVQDYPYFKQKYQESTKRIENLSKNTKNTINADTLTLLKHLLTESQDLLSLKYSYPIPKEYYN